MTVRVSTRIHWFAASRTARVATRRTTALRWRRPAAAAIDTAAFLLAAPLTIGVPGLIAGPFWPLLSAAFATIVFGLAWAEGQTPGQHLAGVRLCDPRCRRACPYRPALLRAALVTVEGASLLVVAQGVLAGAPMAVFAPALVIAAVVVADQLRLLAFPHQPALHDLVSGARLRLAAEPLEHPTPAPAFEWQVEPQPKPSMVTLGTPGA